jgi:hypothetical protein
VSATIAMPTNRKPKPPEAEKPKRRYSQAKIYTRVLQLARAICAYDDTLTIGELVSETCLPVFIKRLHEMGLPIPPDPHPPK